MRNRLSFIAIAASLALLAGSARAQALYVPSEGNLQSRKEFSEHRLGIFLHWGIYSTYAQGEWYLSNSKLDPATYSEAAAGFYPARFDATEWARAFKDSGAGYVTLTSRHHDGFSMFKTAQTPFNVVDATPFGRDHRLDPAGLPQGQFRCGERSGKSRLRRLLRIREKADPRTPGAIPSGGIMVRRPMGP